VPQTTKILTRLLLFPLGLAFLTAGFLIQEGTALSASPQTMPTPDRLAQPTLPAEPSQADRGAQQYWLSCMPCHGDRGQGLTDEFRQTYPPEDRNCWESGCHGERPYDSGFTLPKQIPAIIGPQAALGKFSDAAGLHAYIKTAMPFWKPGSLTEEESWRVTAFLLRENGIQSSKELDASNAGQVLLSADRLPPTPSQENGEESVPQQIRPMYSKWFLVFAAALAVIVVAAISLSRRSTE
jgi:cytochrome c